jgi:hypothetical protein
MRLLLRACFARWSVIVSIIVLFSTGMSMAGDVLVIGDSMMKSVARELKKACVAEKLSADSYTSIGSGLARLDLMDWNKKTDELMKEHKPRTVVVLIGANDNQAMRSGAGTIAFGSPAWDIEYGRRCGKLMDILLDGGAKKVVWLGLPCMREKKLDADAKVISRIMMQQAAARPNVEFVSTYRMFSKDGKYSAYIIKKGGMPLDVRADDGIHFNRNGARYLSERVLPVITGNKKK